MIEMDKFTVLRKSFIALLIIKPLILITMFQTLIYFLTRNNREKARKNVLISNKSVLPAILENYECNFLF